MCPSLNFLSVDLPRGVFAYVVASVALKGNGHAVATSVAAAMNSQE